MHWLKVMRTSPVHEDKATFMLYGSDMAQRSHEDDRLRDSISFNSTLQASLYGTVPPKLDLDTLKAEA